MDLRAYSKQKYWMTWKKNSKTTIIITHSYLLNPRLFHTTDLIQTCRVIRTFSTKNLQWWNFSNPNPAPDKPQSILNSTITGALHWTNPSKEDDSSIDLSVERLPLSMTMRSPFMMRIIGRDRPSNWWLTRNLILKISTSWDCKWPRYSKKTIRSRSKSRHCKTHWTIREVYLMFKFAQYFLAHNNKTSQ